MSLTPKSKVPFGKYKGQMYAVLLQDASYCHYLIRGTWLSGPARELLEGCYADPACRSGQMYATDDTWVTCTACNGKTCLSDRPSF